MSHRSLRVAIVALSLTLVLPLVTVVPASAASGHFTGRSSNGRWVVDVPRPFNGTLLIWSHGYTFTPVGAKDAPSAATRRELLKEGFALAGSSFKRGGTGWDVNQGVRAGVELIAIAKTKIGARRVDRVYAWGNSLGGLITEILAQRHPQLVNGVAPLCGVLAGTNRNLDLALDVAVAVKALFYPRLKLRGYKSAQQAQANVDAAMAEILRRLGNSSQLPAAAARLLAITDLVGGSSKTRDFSGGSFASSVAAAVETLQTALTYGTVGRYDIEQRVHGNPSTNVHVDYRKRVTPGGLARSESYGYAPGLLTAIAKTIQTYGKRVKASSIVRRRANKLGNPTGVLRDRTVTMHTQYDPLVLVQNERVFAYRVRKAGKSHNLHQLWVRPPASWTDGSPSVSTDGAPYGAGHCNFTTDNYLAALHTLDTWVTTHHYVAPAESGGLRTSLAVPAWPHR
jgi:pimeloyl-ACP methyl ester carboxylesterase